MLWTRKFPKDDTFSSPSSQIGRGFHGSGTSTGSHRGQWQSSLTCQVTYGGREMERSSPGAQVHHTTILTHGFTRSRRSQVSGLKGHKDFHQEENGAGWLPPTCGSGRGKKNLRYWKGASERDFLMYSKFGEETNILEQVQPPRTCKSQQITLKWKDLSTQG